MNSPVLAWLDSLHATTLDGAVTADKWPEAQEAHAAIAELIAAAQFARHSALGYTPGVDRRLAKALANVGATP